MVPARSHRRPHAQRLLPQCHGPCRSRRRSGAPGSRGLPKPRAPRSQTLRIPAPRRSPGPPPSLRLRCLLLPASHLPHAPRHLRQRLRNRLHPPPRLALALPGLSRRALRFQPRFACLDSYPSFRHCRTDSPPVARAALRRSVPRRLPGFLSIHRVLSRLGGHLFLRQPFFRFAHRAFHPRPRRFSRSGRAIFPFPARRPRRHFRIPRPLPPLERRPHVPVGFASHPRARPCLLLAGDPQSVFRRPPPARRRFPHLSLQAQGPHAADRRPRPQAARKKLFPTLSLLVTPRPGRGAGSFFFLALQRSNLPTFKRLSLPLISDTLIQGIISFRSFFSNRMATAAPSNAALPFRSATVRIEPPRGLFALRLREVWAYRELLYFFVWRDVKIRYKQTAIGVLWVILQPVLNMLVFTLFFGRLAKLPSDGLPYPLFYFSALVPWTYFAYSLLTTTNVVVENQRLITKVYFPRLILPISTALSGLVDFAIGFVVLAIFTFAYGIRPTLAALWLPALLLLALFTALGVGLWLSALNALYRDVRYIIPFLVQFWMFASPVAYPSSLFPVRWRWRYGLNPMAGVIDGFRWAITGRGHAPGLLLLASAAAVALGLLGGLFFFNRMEGAVADRW